MSKSGTELAKAYVQIIPSAQGIKGSISNVLSGEASAAGDSAGKTVGESLVSKLKKIIVAAGIGTAIKQALTEGADLQQSLGGIETLFKDSADKVIASAKKAYKTAGMSANEYMETVTGFSASLLQGLAGDTDKAADIADMALTDMADNANKMGTSMELIQNAYQGFAKQNYTMLDNLKLGYGGTKTEMERLLADAEKLSGVKYDISNLSDVYSAIHVIQEEMDITGTTAKEAAETFSGSLASMKAAGKDFLANLALGEDVSDSLNAVFETAHTFIANNMLPMLWNMVKAIPGALVQARNLLIKEIATIGENSDQIVKNGISLIKDLATAIVSSVPYLGAAALELIASFGKTLIETDWISVAQDIIGGLKESLDIAAGEIFGSDEDILTALFDSITDSMPEVLDKGIEFITNFLNGIISGIPHLLEICGEILEQAVAFFMQNAPILWQGGAELLVNVVNGIKDNLPAIVETVVTVVDNMLNTFCENAPQMMDAGIEILEQLLSGLWNAAPDILYAIADLVVGLAKTVIKYAPQLIEGGITIIGKLEAGLIKAIPELIVKIPQIIKNIRDKFENAIDWKEVGINVIKGIAKGLGNAASEVVKAMKEVATKALNAFKEKLGIHSPSRVFEDEGGKNIDLGVAKGIKDNTGSIVDSMKEMSRTTIGVFDTDLSYDFNGSGHNFAVSGKTLGKVEQLYSLLDRYLPELANMQLVTDTGALVGELMPKANINLNEMMIQSERGM